MDGSGALTATSKPGPTGGLQLVGALHLQVQAEAQVFSNTFCFFSTQISALSKHLPQASASARRCFL